MIRTIEEVVEKQLCTGCGVCAALEPKRFRMVDTLDHGKRPIIKNPEAPSTNQAIKACPGIHLARGPIVQDRELLKSDLFNEWGPIISVWEGYANDPDIRYSGSSGGVATALSLYCIEQNKANGVIHTAAREDIPYLNETVISKSRSELIKRAGSRYSPASPSEGLAKIEEGEGYVFIGKPCDVAAVKKASIIKPSLNENLALTIAFFCAGTPSIRGVLDLLKTHGINNPDSLKSLRYRGNGWPGMWSATYLNSDGETQTCKLTYQESWGYLQKYRQWRCYICPDHTGEFADISVGDPWYQKIAEGEPGKSLIIVRNKRGLSILTAAVKAGYITLTSENSDLLPMSQPNLISTRASIWGRLIALRIAGAGVPSFVKFSLFNSWLKNLSLIEKLQSIAGTFKRIQSKKLTTKLIIKSWF